MAEFIQKFIIFSENLSPVELQLLIIIIFLLCVYLVLRTMGLGGLLGFLLIAFFAYILYNSNSFEKYKERNRNEAIHMKLIENELEKR